MTVYVSETFDGVTVPNLPTGWSASGGSGATIVTESGVSYSGAQALEFSVGTSNWEIAGKYGATDSTYGNNWVEAKFNAASVTTGSGIQTLGLFLRAVQAPSGTTLPGSAFVLFGSMLTGTETWELGYTNSSGTLTSIKTVSVTSGFSAGAWYRAILTVNECLDTSAYVLTAYIQRVSDGAWLYPSGSWGSTPDVQTPFMSVITGYTFGTGAGAGLGQQTYNSSWSTGTFAGILCKLFTAEVMYVDDFIFQDVPALTGNVPSSPSAAGNEVELIATASASDAGQTGHTGSNLNTADSNFSAYYLSAATYAGEFNQYALLDAGSGNTVIPTGALYSIAQGSDATLLLGGLELFSVGLQVEGSNSTSGPWTQLGVTPTDDFPGRESFSKVLAALRFILGATAYRYFRLRSPQMPCAANQFRMIVTTASIGSASSRPVRPVLSPAAGRYAYGQAVTASSTTGTVGASTTVFYYLEGTRTSLPADPTNLTGTLLTGAYTLPANAPDETVVKVVAYNAGCSTPLSAVTTGHYIISPTATGPRRALAFDGSTGYGQVGNQSSLQLSGDCCFTVAVNVTAKPAAYTPFFSKESGSGTSSSYYMGVNNTGTFGQIYFGFKGGVNEIDYQIPSSAFYGAWHILGGRFTGAGLILYMDGAQIWPVSGVGGNSTAPPVNTSALNIGSYRGTPITYYGGLLTALALFNSDIGDTAMKAITGGTAYPSAYSPAAYFPCQEGDTTSTANVVSGGNSASLNGGATWSSASPTALAGEYPLVKPAFVPDTGVTGDTWFGNGSSVNWPSDLYDTSGNLVFANNADCQFDAATGVNQLIGGNMAGGEMVSAAGLVYYRGHNRYTSSSGTDFLSWTYQGKILCNYPAYIGAATGGSVIDRLHALINPNPLSSANKIAFWANVGAQLNGQAGSWSAPSFSSPLVFQNYVQPNSHAVADCNVFADNVDDGTSHSRNTAYFIFKYVSAGSVFIGIKQCDPATDWVSLTGSTTTIVTAGSNGWVTTNGIEAPFMLKYPLTGTQYYYINCSNGTPYGAGNCEDLYASSTTIAGLGSATASSPWAQPPNSTSVAYNAQSTCWVSVPGLTASGFIIFLDQQDAGDTSTLVQMFNSRTAWFPVTAATVLSGGVMSLPATMAWDANSLPSKTPVLLALDTELSGGFFDMGMGM